MKKIAIPTTRTNEVDAHFGHCEAYTLFTISENNEITGTEMIPSPAGCGCKSNIASDLSQMGIKVMLAGNIGQGAVEVMAMNGITVYRGYSGNVNDVLKSYLDGLVLETGANCNHNHGDEGHSCDH
jgi:predicted Fe-Mo cluster-binding NifX family protein